MNDKDSIARKLAVAHLKMEPSITRILRILASGDEDNPTEPVKLIEVNTATFASGIVPIALGSSESNPFPTVVVEITPQEFGMLQKGSLELPEGWRIGETLYDASNAG